MAISNWGPSKKGGAGDRKEGQAEQLVRALENWLGESSKKKQGRLTENCRILIRGKIEMEETLGEKGNSWG